MRFFSLILSLLFIVSACNKDQSSPASSNDQDNTTSTQEVTSAAPAPTAQSISNAESLIAQIEVAVELTAAQQAQINTIAAQYDFSTGKEETARSFIKQVRKEVLTDAQREAYRANRTRDNR